MRYPWIVIGVSLWNVGFVVIGRPCWRSDSIQAITTWSCGHYALFYLVKKIQGSTLSAFLDMFSPHDHVKDDHCVGIWLRHQIKGGVSWHGLNLKV